MSIINKCYSVDIEINLYRHRYYSGGEWKYLDFIDSHNYIISVIDFCITSAMEKAKQVIIDRHRGEFVEITKLTAEEDGVLSIFLRGD